MTHGYKQPFLVWLSQRAWADADRGNEFQIFLYNDDEDDPAEGAWIDAIDTEPDDGLYERQSLSFGGHSSHIYTKEVGTEFGEVEFDLTETTGEVDSFGIVAPLEYSEGMGRTSQHTEGELVDVFVASAPLDRPIDLSRVSGTWPLTVGAAFVPMY